MASSCTSSCAPDLSFLGRQFSSAQSHGEACPSAVLTSHGGGTAASWHWHLLSLPGEAMPCCAHHCFWPHNQELRAVCSAHHCFCAAGCCDCVLPSQTSPPLPLKREAWQLQLAIFTGFSPSRNFLTRYLSWNTGTRTGGRTAMRIRYGAWPRETSTTRSNRSELTSHLRPGVNNTTSISGHAYATTKGEPGLAERGAT